jgi:hypothetical protein
LDRDKGSAVARFAMFDLGVMLIGKINFPRISEMHTRRTFTPVQIFASRDHHGVISREAIRLKRNFGQVIESAANPYPRGEPFMSA